MNFLVIALRQNENWFATIYNDSDPLFNLLVENTNQMTQITMDNYNVVDSGIVKFSSEDYDNDNHGTRWVVRRVIGFRKCDECGAFITPQDIRDNVSTWDGDRRLCKDCVARAEARNSRNPRIRLSGYHETSGLARVINGEGETFDLSNVLGIGIEMEANATTRIVHDCYINVTEAFYHLANPRSRNRVFRCEQDCTVQAEIISNVFTKKSLYDFDWNILTDTLRLLGNDENVANVGFHVHLSKLWLGNDNKTQALNFLKLQYFLKSYENDFLKISGRKRNEMHWCQFFELNDIETMKQNVLNSNEFDAWDCMPRSHGSALISSNHTIELRIGKSTNDPVKIAHYLKLVLGIVENLKNVPFSKCYCIGRVTRLVPSDTMAYWRKQGCFLTTNAIDERGVTLG